MYTHYHHWLQRSERYSFPGSVAGSVTGWERKVHFETKRSYKACLHFRRDTCGPPWCRRRSSPKSDRAANFWNLASKSISERNHDDIRGTVMFHNPPTKKNRCLLCFQNFDFSANVSMKLSSSPCAPRLKSSDDTYMRKATAICTWHADSIMRNARINAMTCSISRKNSTITWRCARFGLRRKENRRYKI